MKNWWHSLALREKQIVTVGLILILIFILYETIFATLAYHVSQLRQKVNANQTLLAWMQASNAQIQQLEKNPAAESATDAMSLLSLVQNALNDGEINQTAAKLQQAENDAVQLQLQKINFDTFIEWLTTLCQQHQLLITQLIATPLDELGTVNLDLKLSRS